MVIGIQVFDVRTWCRIFLIVLPFYSEKQVFQYDDIGVVSRVRVNGRLFVVPKEEVNSLVNASCHFTIEQGRILFACFFVY